MDYIAKRQKFIETWGELGVNWGVNKTMGQIHALLLVGNKPMCCESIMKQLQISRGNANMNLRKLIDWKLVHKTCEDGCRKEFFTAEKDIWTAFKMIIAKRKEKELTPLLELLHEVSDIEPENEEMMEFRKVVSEIEMFSSKADAMLGRLTTSNSNFLTSAIVKLIR